MLKKSKKNKKNKMKLRSRNKSRKVKGGTIYKSVRKLSSVVRAAPVDSVTPTVPEESVMSDVPEESVMPTVPEESVVNNAPATASVFNNTVANSVKKYISLRKRDNTQNIEIERIKLERQKERDDKLNSKNEIIINKWKEIANKQFKNLKELHEYRNFIKNNEMENVEQFWADKNVQPIADFMGLKELWEIMIPNIDAKTEGRNFPTKSKSDENQAIYTGRHWLSRKAYEDSWFDPYNEYQIHGTNQFCQTYSMMYLLNKLPPEGKDEFIKYYKYTEEALKFIKNHAFQHTDNVVNIINDKIDNLIKTINDVNKNEIKSKVRGYILKSEGDRIQNNKVLTNDETPEEFNKRYKDLTVENIKKQLMKKKYIDVNNYKTNLKNAIEECLNYTNLCLNTIHINEI